MKEISIIQLGLGNVGKALLNQIIRNNPFLREKGGLKFKYQAVVDSQALVINEAGLGSEDLIDVLKVKKTGSLSDLANSIEFSSNSEQGEILTDLFKSNRVILVDLTGSEAVRSLLLKASEKNCGVVLANKIPLTGKHDDYNTLINGEIGYETTVGAGLPVIDTLQKLKDCGDQVVEIKGALSGTLNFIFSQIEHGLEFSSAVKEAYEAGYTEPDPRTDLSGTDLARKALILARSLRYNLEIGDVQVEPLYPRRLDRLSVEDFLSELGGLDAEYGAKCKPEGKGRKRYLVNLKGGCARVSIENLSPESPFVRLDGPENLVSFTTERYCEYPLLIRGPGAGPEVTAAGVLTDMISISAKMSGLRRSIRSSKVVSA